MYSQAGQDKWVCDMFHNKRDGFFIDIGACDGQSISNTYYLEKELGWTGICIEPAKAQFEKLKALRNCICINKAMYFKEENVRFMEYSNAIYGGNITDINVDGTGIQYEIESVTFDSLFKEYDIPTVIDYISLDVEGLEYEILKTFPFRKHISRLWTIEYNDHREEIKRLMADNRYTLVSDAIKKEAWWEDWFYYR